MSEADLRTNTPAAVGGGRPVPRPSSVRRPNLDSVRDDLAEVIQRALEPARLSVWLSHQPDGETGRDLANS